MQLNIVNGRLTTDNILLAQEKFHALRTNQVYKNNILLRSSLVLVKKKGHKNKVMATKVIITKSPRPWKYLEVLMLRLGLPNFYQMNNVIHH